MKVVILCGGRGTRLRGEADARPKPLVPIGGRPLLWHVMKIFSAQGYREFVLCLGYRAEAIKEYFLNYELYRADFTLLLGSGSRAQRPLPVDEQEWRITFVDSGERVMTGGRIRRARPYLDDDETFLLTYADGVADIDLKELVAFHQTRGRVLTVSGVHPRDRFGRLQVEGDLAGHFAEKPLATNEWVNGGFFVGSQRLFDYLYDDDCVLEGAPLERLAREGQLAVYRHQGYWQCVDTPSDLETIRSAWRSGEAPWRVWPRGLDGD